MGLPFLKGQPVMMRTANGDAQRWRLRLVTSVDEDGNLRTIEEPVTGETT